MSATERDPRLNPMPGDVLRKMQGGSWFTRRVIYTYMQATMGVVVYAPKSGQGRECWYSAWRKWAKDAEVIHREGKAGE